MSKPNSKEALAAAIKYLKADRWLGVWLKDSESRVDVRRTSLMQQAGCDVIEGQDGIPEVKYTGKNAKNLITLANTGDQIAHQALCAIAQRLTVNGETLPRQLQFYVVAAASELKRGKRGKRVQVFNDLRDGAIFNALEVVMTFGFNATRNAEHKEGVESACSIVSEALGKSGAPLSESQVAKIMDAQLDGWTKAGVILMPVWEEYLKSKSARRLAGARPGGGPGPKRGRP
jgi:hypothetical protein